MNWNPTLTIRELKKIKIINYYIRFAETLYRDLKQNKLEVVLIPAPRPLHMGHMIRVAINQNPEWYKIIFREYYPNFRRNRSLRSLKRIT